MEITLSTKHPDKLNFKVEKDFWIRRPDGHAFRPVGFDGENADPLNPEIEPWGKVTVTKITEGCSSKSWREYSSLKSAKVAAKRIFNKLAASTTADDWNNAVDNWIGE